jgi:hypothetical protein
VAGTAALAADSGPHEMTVRLPGGGVERIEYKGNVAPRIVVRQSPFDVTWPVMIGFEPSSLAVFDQMAARMDREMAAFRRQAESLQNIAMPNGQGLDEAALRNLPPGAMSYSSVSFSTGSGMCSRSVEVTRSANGGKPQVVSHSSGDCGDTKSGHGLSTAPNANNAPIPIRYDASNGDRTF